MHKGKVADAKLKNAQELREFSALDIRCCARGAGAHRLGQVSTVLYKTAPTNPLFFGELVGQNQHSAGEAEQPLRL